MCVTSMVMDHYRERWEPLVPIQPIPMIPIRLVQEPAISPEEIAEFRKLLERAREYDKRHNEPDCELDEKREVIQRIAKQLGVEVAFI